MAEKSSQSVGDGQAALSGLTLPSAGIHGVQQDGQSFALDFNSGGVAQPFPRSPKLQRKVAKAAQPSKEQLSRCLEELQAEKSKTEAHIQSLKKRKADLCRRTDMMKHQVHDCFENMRAVLKKDEQAIMESLDLDLKRTRTRLDQVLRNWKQHQDKVGKSISSTQRALSSSCAAEGDGKGHTESLSPKRPDASEKDIRLNEERFERLLKTLSSISKSLKAQLQRKTLLLDFSPVVMDRHTCHSHITVTSEGRALTYSGTARSALDHPLQFDKVCCALGASPVKAGTSYWEVDVRCCSAWAVGVTYASLHRKSRDKGAKLGRNRNSWCVELRNRNLWAWHNDRHVVCHGVGQTLLRKVGVWVNYDESQLFFYDADTMTVLQRFSSAITAVFDRAHHQFTEPLYPAVRFLRPSENQVWPNHLELCHFNAL
ncbi:zinc-binding protein A33 isoform X2 [Betta splendens]|uniref:Zinc-binding protein A33 isoform X2 n=1 Tax=Betta splendens TaxID=158456 RepID=A0A9W2XB46_BETSP|nr:zinc-binding protein A33 isoform X2 [Betta splendens]